MTLEEFCALLDACGPDLHAWPPDEQDGASALLRGSAAARAALQDARAVSGALGNGVAVEREAAVRRIVARLAEPGPQESPATGERRFRLWTVAPALLVGMAVLGFLVGLVDAELLAGSLDLVPSGSAFGIAL